MKGNPVRLLLLAAAFTISSCEGPGGLVPVTETPQPPDETPEVPPVGLDFGDAPDPSFPSLLASDGARATPGSFWLGELGFPPTAEVDAKLVDLDELDDGLIRLLVTPGRALVTFQAVLAESAEPQTAYFNLLADVNRDGRWQAFQGEAGIIEEWAVVNQEVLLSPGERRAIDTEFVFLRPGTDLWFRATLTGVPVESLDWDGTGEFEEGEIEDYKVPSGSSADWDFDCDPDPLVLIHGETGEIGFKRISGDGAPDSLRVVGKFGEEGEGDPLADEIDVDPPVDPLGPPLAFPDVVFVESLVVHGPLKLKTYVIPVLLEGQGRWQVLDCEVEVWHWDPQPPVIVDGDSVIYNGPPQVKSGGTLRARFHVTDADGRPAEGELSASFGNNPAHALASHATGQVVKGKITLELPVNWPPGLITLWISWGGQVVEIAQIEVLP